MSIEILVPTNVRERFDVREWRNGLAGLHTAHRAAWKDIIAVLSDF